MNSVSSNVFGKLISIAGDTKKFTAMTTKVIEQTSEYTLDGEELFTELEGCEKTIFGTKFEKRFVTAFGLPRKVAKKSGKNAAATLLDTCISGIDVDIKATLGGKTWMIPMEARGQWCLLVQVDYRRSLYSFGMLLMEDANLNFGENRDKKVSVSASGITKIDWAIKDEPFDYSKRYEAGLMDWA